MKFCSYTLCAICLYSSPDHVGRVDVLDAARLAIAAEVFLDAIHHIGADGRVDLVPAR